MRGLGHERRGLVDLEQAQVRPPGDRQQHAVRAVDRSFQQRTGDRRLRRLHRPVVPARRADAHQRGTGTLHHRLHVGEVEVDQTRGRDQVGDAGDTLQQHLVGRSERVEHADLAVGDRQQPVVGDDDERVDLVAQLVDAGLGRVGPPTALEAEGTGDHADRQGTQRTGDPGDDRRAAGARPPALAGGDEDHVRALEHLLDLLGVLLGRPAADLGVGAGAQPPGELAPDVELDVGITHQQRLRVGVDGDELDALEPDLDHAVDGVDTAAADADDLDDRQVVLRCCHDGASHSGRKLRWIGASTDNTNP